MPQKLHKLSIIAPRSVYELLTAHLSLNSSFGWQEEDLDPERIQFILHCDDKNFLEKLAHELQDKFSGLAFEISEQVAKDWLSSWKEFFTPVYCGQSFVVLPPWLAPEAYGNRHKIIIEPKSAFGTGHHASTALCLRALDALLQKGALQANSRFLDLGCGTAVLGIAAALAGLQGLCVDIDPIAVSNAKENVENNGLSSAVQVYEGSLEKIGAGKFALIMANILARPLIDMAAQIYAALAPGGSLILSGILTSQADEVSAAYKACGLKEPEKIIDGEWVALSWMKSNESC